VWAASGGIAPALAAHLPEPRGSNPQRPIAASGPILTVVGSWSAIATEQVRHLQATGARTCVFAISALDGRDAALAARCVAEVLMHLRRAEDVIVTLPAVNAPVASAGGERLVARLGTLLRPAADLVGGLILAGGDTAVGLLRAWGIEALRIAGEIDAGIPVSVGSGGRPIPIVTKAGAFGGPGSLTLARDRLRRLGA
jgi:4-hydroxythreonine-4-phosphate dehydrogenase